MLNTEECREEENYYTNLEEWIHWVTKINDARLYWLWMKFFITAGASSGWIGFSKAQPVLNRMKPVTDVLSWSILSGRLMLQLLWVRQQTLQSMKQTPTHMTQAACLSDFLWIISNLLSAQWLHSHELRPSLGNVGWWGNMCMQVLLIYDVVFVVWQFKQEQQQANDWSMLSHAQQISWHTRKLVLWSNLAYTTHLACGFLLFRGFAPAINKTIPPEIGAGVCAVSTNIFRAIEWSILLSKLQKKQHFIAPNTLESQAPQHAFQTTCVTAGLSIGLDLLLPLLIGISRDKNHVLLVISLSLSINLFINGCFKRDKASPLSRYSLFSLYQRSSAPPVVKEVRYQADAPNNLEMSHKARHDVFICLA